MAGMAAALALVLSACTTTTPSGDPSSSANPSTSTSSGTTTPLDAGIPVGLETYYRQDLRWQGCEAGAECATMKVPLDYDKPAGATIEIALLRQRATGDRIGSLIINPGGPGGSGISMAKSSDRFVDQPVRRAYDIVGFDPRGIGRSAGVDCLDPVQLDSLVGSDPTPDTPAEEAAVLDWSGRVGQGCLLRSPEVARHISTVETVRDMDILRHLLGDRKINYYGASYGTLIGALYADRFPTRVGRMVLDGAVPPDLSNEEYAVGQAVGFEVATREYVRSCVAQSNCPIGKSVDEGMEWLRAFLKQLDATPLKVKDQTISGLTEGWATYGILLPMYNPQAWPSLNKALQDAKNGDGTVLLRFAEQYASRNPGGGYEDNSLQAFFAVSCLDRAEPGGTVEKYRALATRLGTVAPTWGPMMAWGNSMCANWPIQATGAPHKASAAGSDQIVVIGTTRDPATPYEWAVRVRGQLSNAALLTYDGDGHTAYMRSNGCINGAVNGYFVGDTKVKDGTRC